MGGSYARPLDVWASQVVLGLSSVGFGAALVVLRLVSLAVCAFLMVIGLCSVGIWAPLVVL